MYTVIPEFWGKLSHPDADHLEYLPLRTHCLDVAEVFYVLVTHPIIKRRLDMAAGVTLAPAQLAKLAVLALLHDLGKVNLGFQHQYHNGVKIGHIQPLQAIYGDQKLGKQLQVALSDLLCWTAPPEAIYAYLWATWSHHGSPVQFDETIKTNYDSSLWQPQGKLDPFAGIAELLTTARSAFPLAFDPTAPPLPGPATLQHRFAGLVMLADWLGSHTSFFPMQRPANFDTRAVARQSVMAVGLDATAARVDLAQRPLPFSERFGFPPHPLQMAIEALSVMQPEQRLLIAEAETGSGKTEAALGRFFHLFAAGEVDGLYFALPTRVAARELYKRICAHLCRAFPDPLLRPRALLAVPRYAQVDGVPTEQILSSTDVLYDDNVNQRRAEGIWAAEHPKRFLAATVAVGTIDQALLSAVQTKHAHLRSVCLDRNLLVVDEVHASDAYMRYLLCTLLAHHIGGGGHALLLSATLGAAARSEFIAAATGKRRKAPTPSFVDAVAAPYPALTNLTGLPLGMTEAATQHKRVQFALRPTMQQPETLVPELAAALAAGARILVVLNTVGRAVALQRAVEATPTIAASALFQCAGVVCPHHGRFAPADREHLDQAVSTRLGKDSAPGPLLLIGTQTLEQSLDIDADLLVTDLCPADVLLQRVGRLHRHTRDRPLGYTEPCCLVLVPDDNSLEAFLDAKGTPNSTAKALGLGSVYEDLRILELTRLILAQTPLVEIPTDNRRVVESATHPECLATLSSERWKNHAQTVAGATLAKKLAGQYAAAQFTTAFTELPSFHDIADNPRARTRLGLDTLRLRLPQSTPGPFGNTIDDMCIPGHLAPIGIRDEVITVLSTTPEAIMLRLKDRHYRYSRLGLEAADV